MRATPSVSTMRVSDDAIRTCAALLERESAESGAFERSWRITTRPFTTGSQRAINYLKRAEA
jgi:hypothetical protein